jgi:hypothetical protein
MPNRRTVAIVVSAALLAGATSGVAAAVAGLRLPAMLIASGGRTPSPAVSVVRLDPTPTTKSPTASSSPSVPAATSPPPSAKPPVTRTVPPKTSKPPKKTTKPKDPKPSWTPTPLPTEITDPEHEEPTRFVSTTFGPGPSDGKPGHKVKVTVPDGWEAVETGTFKRDFRDPTKQLTLRVWGVNGFGAPAIEGNADAEFEKRKSLADFQTDGGVSTNSWKAADGRTIWFHWFTYSWTEDGRTRYATEWYPFQEDETPYGTWTMIGAVASGDVFQLAKLDPAMGKALESYTDYPVDP